MTRAWMSITKTARLVTPFNPLNSSSRTPYSRATMRLQPERRRPIVRLFHHGRRGRAIDRDPIRMRDYRDREMAGRPMTARVRGRGGGCRASRLAGRLDPMRAPLRQRRRGFVRALRSRPALLAPSAGLLTLLQSVLLAVSVLLHTHVVEGISIDDLPAAFHHHDFQLGEGGEPRSVTADICLACRLERTPGGPPSMGPTLASPEHAPGPGSTFHASVRAAEPRLHHPRAPPSA